MNSNGNHKPDSSSSADFQQAVERLEEAVQKIVGSKKAELSGRATAFIDDTTDRLLNEFAVGGDNGQQNESRRHHRRHYHRQRPSRHRRRSTDAKIAGVCLRIADYYGMEPWVVRLIAVTGLLFLPSIVFPAYWILYFVMKSPSRSESASPDAVQDHSSPAPELGPQLSPRHSLRSVQDTLSQAELKLRRMESHLTSGQFELQRDLRRLDT